MLDLSRQKVLNLAAHHSLSHSVKSVRHLALGYHWSRRPQVLTIERICCRTLVPRAFERICLRTLVPRTFARINGNFKVMQPQHVLFQDFVYLSNFVGSAFFDMFYFRNILTFCSKAVLR